MPSHEQLVVVGGYASADQPGIFAFGFDAATGALTPRGAHAGVERPSFLVVHPSGRWLYAVSETDARSGAPGAVWAFRMAAEPWALEPINHQASGGDWPCHLEIDPSGRWLLVSNYGSGTVGVLPIQPDGGLGELSDLVQHHGGGPDPERQEGPHAHSATFTPDQRLALVADLGLDALIAYTLDPASGKLAEQSRAQTRPGAGPRHVAFHPNGRRVYVGNELGNTVAVYDYDGKGETLRELQVVDTLPPGAPKSYVADIHLAPGGDRLYVSNRGHDSIAVFDVGQDGLLSRVAVPPCGGKWPRNFALAPGGRFMLAANQHSDEVAVLPISNGTQALGAPVARVSVPGASCVQFCTTL